jgi:hypothetical protein
LEEKIKFIELTSEPWADRWKVLQGALLEKKKTLDCEIISISDLRELQAKVSSILHSDARLCRVGDRLVPEIFKFLINTTFDVSFSNSIGLLEKIKGKWWPKPFLDLAFIRSVSAKMGQLDLNSSALVIGSGGAAKLVISSLVRMGFSAVNIADNDKLKGKATVAELQKRFFAVKFDYIPTQNLTMLPGVHSLVVNTNPLSDSDDLYTELYFFNFLKPGGVVVDLTLVPARSPLIIEAEKWGARFLEGDAIAADRDCLMVEEYLDLRLDSVQYRKKLREVIDAVPFDPAPYLKKFSERAL